jgi:hypothetical protein
MLYSQHQKAFLERAALIIVALLAAAILIYPVFRAFSLVQVSYNEGWNVYNSATVDHHLPLYVHKIGWTTVNYPALSFYVVAGLHHLGITYLLAGRMLSLISLLVSCLLVGFVVWRFCRDSRAAIFAALFCLMIFGFAANDYVAADDPQVFAQVFLLGGFLLYISGRHFSDRQIGDPPRVPRLALVALLFVIGGCIKHNLIEFPLAVMIDLAFVSKKKFLQFLAISSVLLAVAIYLNIRVGGPYFVADILTPRPYSAAKAALQFLEFAFLPIAVVAAFARIVWSRQAFHNDKLRVLAILFIASVIFGAISGGGIGVWVNSYFDMFLSLSMIVGLIMHEIWQGEFGQRHPSAFIAAPLLFLLGFVPAWLAGPNLFRGTLTQLAQKQNDFQAEVSFLRDHSGPAFCQSLLRCYEAGKPYEYDPFNMTSLARVGKLDPTPFLDRIRRAEFSTIQLCCSIDFLKGDDDPNVIPQMLAVLETSYELGLAHEGCYIYVPKRR